MAEVLPLNHYDDNYVAMLRIIINAYDDQHVHVLNYMRRVAFDAYKGDEPMINHYQAEVLTSVIDNLLRILGLEPETYAPKEGN